MNETIEVILCEIVCAISFMDSIELQFTYMHKPRSEDILFMLCF